MFFILMFDLFARFRFCESHVEGNAGNDRLPRLIFGEAPAFDRAPKVNDLLLSYAFEEVLISFHI